MPSALRTRLDPNSCTVNWSAVSRLPTYACSSTRGPLACTVRPPIQTSAPASTERHFAFGSTTSRQMPPEEASITPLPLPSTPRAQISSVRQLMRVTQAPIAHTYCQVEPVSFQR
jgi:hypothetical protein